MAKNEQKTVLIECVIGELGTQYQPNHVDVHLDYDRAQTLRRLMNGAFDSGLRLKDGRPVASAPDVVRWWLDKIRGDI